MRLPRALLLLLLLVLVVIPAVEIATFIGVGGRIGALATVLLTLFTAALGIWLVRLQGLLVMNDVGRALARGVAPTREVIAGMLLALAGVLLLLPGFVTDAVGFLLLMPPLRRLLAGLLARGAMIGVGGASGRAGGTMRVEAEVIEVEVHEVRDADVRSGGQPSSEGRRNDDDPPRRLPPD